MRKTLTSLVLLAALTAGVGGTHAEHVTPEELAFNSLQSQNVQEFADQFKQFTDARRDLRQNDASAA